MTSNAGSPAQFPLQEKTLQAIVPEVSTALRAFFCHVFMYFDVFAHKATHFPTIGTKKAKKTSLVEHTLFNLV